MCDSCTSRAAEEQDRRSRGVARVRLPTGEVVEVAAPATLMEARLRFELSALARTRAPLAAKAPASTLFTLLQGLLQTPLPYLRASEAPRYASMLADLAQFRVRARGVGAGRERTVAELPIADLDFAAHEWVGHYLHTAPDSLMPSYALATCEFLSSHIYGTTLRSDRDDRFGLARAELTPLVTVDERDWKRGFRFAQETSFKRDFTATSARGLVVVARVPAGTHLEVGDPPTRLAEAGSAVYFVLDRCHLSSAIDDYPDVAVADADAPRFDLDADFEFYGALLGAGPRLLDADRDVTPPDPFDTRVPHRGRLPGRWFEAVLRRTMMGEPLALADRTAVPKWGV